MCSSQVLCFCLQLTTSRALGGSGSIGCEVIGDQFSLSGFVWDLIALGSMKRFSGGIEVGPLVLQVLKKVRAHDKDRFSNAASRNEAAVLAVAQGASREVGCAVRDIGKEPGVGREES